MFKLFLVMLLAGVAYAGYANNYGWGYNFAYQNTAGGDYNNNNNGWNQGWSRPGWANVKVQQNDKAYQYNLQEHGKDYERYVHQGAEVHHEQPVQVQHGNGWGNY